MKRDGYQVFSRGQIGQMTLSNRLVRSLTWDPCIHGIRRVTDEVLDLYRDLALGGVGLIITGGLPVFRERFPDEEGTGPKPYPDLCIEGIEKMVRPLATKEIGQIAACFVEAMIHTKRADFDDVQLHAAA